MPKGKSRVMRVPASQGHWPGAVTWPPGVNRREPGGLENTV